MDIKWPSAIVALGVFALIGTIVVAAILKYATVGEAMKVFSGLWERTRRRTSLCLFLMRGRVQQAQATSNAAKGSAEEAQRTAQSVMTLANAMKDEVDARNEDMANTYRKLVGAVGMEPNQAKRLLEG